MGLSVLSGGRLRRHGLCEKKHEVRGAGWLTAYFDTTTLRLRKHRRGLAESRFTARKLLPAKHLRNAIEG
jgi:hypothetical protein